MDNIAICCDHNNILESGSFENDHLEHAKLLAQQLSLPLLDDCQNPEGLSYLLTIASGSNDFRLELRFPNENLNPVCVDFLDEKFQHRKNYGGGRQQAIAKAVGLKRGQSPSVLDGTAGLGKDAFVLSSLGCDITLCERNTVIHALLADGLRRLNHSSTILPSMKLRFQDTLEHLKANPMTYDVIYLDPMYPHRTKSALVKKEMRILRNLVGDDKDFDGVFEAALLACKQRVVIKRPKTATPIGSIAPSHSIESKKTRYDVYLTHRGSAQP